MCGDRADKIDDLRSGLDELITTIDELLEDPLGARDRATLATVRAALHHAREVADRLDDQQARPS